MCDPSSAPSRLRAICRKSAAFIVRTLLILVIPTRELREQRRNLFSGSQQRTATIQHRTHFPLATLSPTPHNLPNVHGPTHLLPNHPRPAPHPSRRCPRLDARRLRRYALRSGPHTYIMRDLGMIKAVSGFLATLTLLASGIGGVLFGFIADRIGRKRALMLSILTYSVCSFASGLSRSVLMLAIFRFILGLGMGGEWNTGASLVAETWPT